MTAGGVDRGQPLIPVAAYVRVSTEMQPGSLPQQAAAIEAYADTHGMWVVRTYCDEGLSGLTAEQRPGLLALLQAVALGSADFQAVLVLDVSRWGRFQNTDEAAYYEFVCWKAGIQVCYVAEPFANDGSPFSMIVKGLKRVMAAEFSRDLSAKVRAGQRRIAELGYRQGGLAGYGLRRLLLDKDGTPKGLLDDGDRKSVATDRVVLVPGPPEEVVVVREIFQAYLREPCFATIARQLRARGISGVGGRPWSPAQVNRLLAAEKYAGRAFYGRASRYLAGPLVHHAEAAWVRKDGAYEPVVSPALFDAVQAVRRQLTTPKTNDEVLDDLRALLARHGHLTRTLIDVTPGMMSAPRLVERFGSLTEVYRKVGYVPRSPGYGAGRLRLTHWRKSLTGFLRDRLRDAGSVVEQDGWCLRVDHAWTVSFSVLMERDVNPYQGWVSYRAHADTDIVVLARLPRHACVPCDYLMLPRLVFPTLPGVVARHRGGILENFRYPSLAMLDDLAQLSRMQPLACRHRPNGRRGPRPEAQVRRAAAVAELRFARVDEVLHALRVRHKARPLLVRHGLFHVGKARSHRNPMNHRYEGRVILEGVVLAGVLNALLGDPGIIQWLAQCYPRERAMLHEASVLR